MFEKLNKNVDVDYNISSYLKELKFGHYLSLVVWLFVITNIIIFIDNNGITFSLSETNKDYTSYELLEEFKLYNVSGDSVCAYVTYYDEKCELKSEKKSDINDHYIEGDNIYIRKSSMRKPNGSVLAVTILTLIIYDLFSYSESLRRGILYWEI